MKSATKVLIRRMARDREAREVAALRDALTGEGAFIRAGDDPRVQLPLSRAPYRLQAANRWWRELGLPADPQRRRSET